MISTWRIALRTLLLSLHILLGLILTPLVLSRHPGGVLRTHPRIESWWHNRVADILGVRITVAGYRPQAPAFLVANHISWLDIIVLGALTPTDFLSKYEVRRWPLIGWLAACAGTLFIRRGNGEAAQITEQISKRLRDNGMLTVFPEGTTTDGTLVRPFFSRLFAAPIDTRTDVVPVAVRYHINGHHDPVAPYTDDQSLGENLRGLITRDKTEVMVIFGEPITLSGHSRKQVADEARNAIIMALHSHEQTPLGERVPAPAAG